MEVLECIKTRRSCRRFLPTEVEKEKLDKVIEAGRSAPSGGNCQSCHLIVIKNQRILAELAGIVQDEFAKMELQEGMYKSLVNSITLSRKGNYVFHYAPNVFIVVANQKGYGNAMADSACALQNMMLAANALDLGSCWINQLHWLDENVRVNEYMRSLGLGDDETICGALSLGYAADLNRSITERHGNPVTCVE